MQNLLVIEDDLIQAHFMINSICKEISDIRLYNIVSTGKEAIDIIKEEKADIIILDLKLPDMTGIDIIDYISKHNIIKYLSSIIVTTGKMDLLTKIIGNKYIFNYTSKTNGIDFIIKQIKNLIKDKEKQKSIDMIKEKIKNELETLGFGFSYIGTKYLCDCIYECHLKDNIYDINLNKEIYPIISKKYNKTISSIKTSIFQATSIMYYETEEKKLKEYFGYNIISKPKAKDIITTVLLNIK